MDELPFVPLLPLAPNDDEELPPLFEFTPPEPIEILKEEDH